MIRTVFAIATLAGMIGSGAEYQMVTLPGALHGFSNPDATANGEKFGLALRYNELADDASWAHMQLVFNKLFSD